MSGHLNGMPVGATILNPRPDNPNAVTPAERRNRMPIYITGFSDTRGFLAWLRWRCPKGISAQMKGELLMVVPGMADVSGPPLQP
jgi:hypothetical protein